MRVLINAVSIKDGGSRVVLQRLLAAMCQLRPDAEWIVAANPKCEPVIPDVGSVRWKPIQWIDKSPLHLIGWYELVLPAIIRKYRANVLFSQTNYLPRRPVHCRTLLLIQHAGHFSPVFNRLMRGSLPSARERFLWERKRRWVHRSAKAASLLTVQTKALAEAVAEQTGRSRDMIAVIPHGPGQVEQVARPPMRRPGGATRIGYLTRFGVQKNFETVFRAVRLLADAGHRMQLVLSLDEKDQANRDVLARAEHIGVQRLIENRGEMRPQDVSTVYDSLDISVFASLCESFGLPMVEAMARGVPLVVADVDSNIEVTQGAALSFPATDAGALADTLSRLMSDPAEYKKRSELGLKASANYSWSKAAGETISVLESLT